MNINMKNGAAEILLYEDIGGWFGITADSFVKEVKSLGKIGEINLRINSNGGNVFDGLAIHNYLKSHEARVTVDVDGLAASIASIIAMAGDEIRMADNAWMMIHDPWIVTGGTADELRQTAETMDGVRETLLDTYVKRSGGERGAISDMMKAETWLNAEDARQFGLADSLTQGLQIAASVHKDWFKHPPEILNDSSVVEVHNVEDFKKNIADIAVSGKPRHEHVRQALARQQQVLRRLKI